MATEQLALDDNLRNGITYTFSFKLGNLFRAPSDATILQDVYANAPDFLTSVQVTHQERFLSGDTYNVQFTYEGDGSDVVSDLGLSLVNCFTVGSNDDFSFLGAIAATSDFVQSQAGEVVGGAGKVLVQAGQQVGQTAGGITSGALGGVKEGLGAWLIPVVLVLVVVLLFQLGGVSGIRRQVA